MVADLQAHFQSVEDVAKQFLETHIPGLADFARKVESSPLLLAAEAIAGTVDPAAEAILAKALADLASIVPPAPPPAAAEVAPADSTPDQVPAG
jgi:hypothetical protein